MRMNKLGNWLIVIVVMQIRYA